MVSTEKDVVLDQDNLSGSLTQRYIHTYIHKFICLGGSEKATLKADVDPHFVKPRSLCRAKSGNQYTIFVTSEL